MCRYNVDVLKMQFRSNLHVILMQLRCNLDVIQMQFRCNVVCNFDAIQVQLILESYAKLNSKVKVEVGVELGNIEQTDMRRVASAIWPNF